MADWEQLRELAHEIEVPELRSLARTARHRQLRARAAVGVLAGLVLLGGGVGLASVGGTDRDNVQPVQDPTGRLTDAPGGVLPLPAPDPGSNVATVDAGRYRVPLDDGLAFEVDLPDHTSAHDGGLFLASGSIVLKTEVAGADYGVPRDPCTRQTIDPVGPTVDDLVHALGELPVYRVTLPRPVELGGAEGSYVEARVPRAYDASQCDRQQVQLPGDPRTAVGGAPPYLGRWWILDVDGTRVVVQQNCWGCSAEELDRAVATAQSITFTPER
ncbi:MAG TPA: hypothetical protein VNS55_11595 [Nocardioides sp.]|nr:hypothetical protein [Nocardioides sp.]